MQMRQDRNHLFAIVQYRAEDRSEQFEVHDQVQEVNRVVEGIPLKSHEAQETVANVIEDQLMEGRG